MTTFAPLEILKSTVQGKLTFDERVVPHRVVRSGLIKTFARVCGTTPSTFGLRIQSTFGVSTQLNRCQSAVKRMWHMKDSQGQIKALAFRQKVFKPN